MTTRLYVGICLVGSLVMLATGPALTQGREGSTIPLTPWGDPDLQGLWTNTTTTPLERPADLADKDVLTDEERAAIDEENAPGIDAAQGVGAYNSFWVDRGTRVRANIAGGRPAERTAPDYPAQGQAAT